LCDGIPWRFFAGRSPGSRPALHPPLFLPFHPTFFFSFGSPSTYPLFVVPPLPIGLICPLTLSRERWTFFSLPVQPQQIPISLFSVRKPIFAVVCCLVAVRISCLPWCIRICFRTFCENVPPSAPDRFYPWEFFVMLFSLSWSFPSFPLRNSQFPVRSCFVSTRCFLLPSWLCDSGLF